MKKAYILPAAVLSLSLIFGSAAYAGDLDSVYAEENEQNNSQNDSGERFITQIPEIIVENPKDCYDVDEIVEVVITASDGFDIYYTLDGSDPLNKGILYEGTIEIPAPHRDTKIMLRAVAVMYIGSGDEAHSDIFEKGSLEEEQAEEAIKEEVEEVNEIGEEAEQDQEEDEDEEQDSDLDEEESSETADDQQEKEQDEEANEENKNSSDLEENMIVNLIFSNEDIRRD